MATDLRKLCMNKNINKGLSLCFEDDEIEPLGSANIKEESLSIEEKLCTEKELKFGLCEATKIEMECTGVKKSLKGKKFFLNFEFGEENEKVIHKHGKYTIRNCRKQANMDIRRIVAYDDFSDSVFDKNMMGWFRERNKVINAQDTSATPIYPSNLIQDVVGDLLLYIGLEQSDKYKRKVQTGNIAYDDLMRREKDRLGNTYNVINGSKIRTLSNASITSHLELNGVILTGKEKYLYSICARTTKEVEIPNKYRVEIEFDTEEVTALNDYLNQEENTSCTVKERIEKIRTEMCVECDATDQQGNKSTLQILPNMTVTSSDKLMGTWSYCGKIVVSKDSNNNYNIGDPQTVICIFSVVKNIKVVEIVDCNDLINGQEEFRINYYSETDSTNVDNDKLTARNIIGSILEINGLFGKLDNDGNFEYRKLGKPRLTVSSNFVLCAGALNDSQIDTIPPGEDSATWYDEELIQQFGKIRVVGTDGLTLCEYVGDRKREKTYIIKDNLLFATGEYGIVDMMRIIENMYTRIKAYKIMSLDTELDGDLSRQVGDRIAISDGDETIRSYIMQKSTTGIIAMQDSIETTIEE